MSKELKKEEAEEGVSSRRRQGLKELRTSMGMRERVGETGRASVRSEKESEADSMARNGREMLNVEGQLDSSSSLHPFYRPSSAQVYRFLEVSLQDGFPDGAPSHNQTSNNTRMDVCLVQIVLRR